jgi:hypothetical protein
MMPPAGELFAGTSGGALGMQAPVSQFMGDSLPKLTGIDALMNDPLQYLKENKSMVGLPLLASSLASSNTNQPKDGESESNIRQYDYDPVGRSFTRRPVVSASNYAGRMPSIYGYAEGGQVEEGQMESIKNQIARVYRTYLQREPDQAGLNYWANSAAAGTPMPVIIQQIKASEEGKNLAGERGIEDAYRDYLGRTPDAAGKEYWMGDIQKGATPEQIRAHIMQSPEAAGIAAAAQQRQQAFSPLPPTAPMTGATPVQQAGVAMIPNRYQAPVNVPSQAVSDYNQLLANRANYEYNQMPMPQALRPRTPVEQERYRDRQLMGQQMQYQSMQPAAPAPVTATPAPAGSAEDYSQGYRTGWNPNAGSGNKEGGAIKLASGGITAVNQIPRFQEGGEMESDAFVVPADVVSALGNGSTKAGVEVLNQYLGMAMLIEGDGDGLSDDIPATIEGSKAARIADGEVYIPAEVVAMLGEGDPEEGAEKLYEMMDKIRAAAHGKTKQQAEVNPEEVMPE